MGKTLNAGYAELYEAFIGFQSRRMAVRSLPSLKMHTRFFLSWLENEDKEPEAVTIQDVLAYSRAVRDITNRNGQPISNGTIMLYLYSGRMLYDYLLERERCTSNPFREIPYPKQGTYLSRNVLNPVQMSQLLDTLSHFDTASDVRRRGTRYRLHVIAEFLYATGLRIAEAASLTEANLDLDKRFVYVKEGKGGVPRTAFLTGYAADVMRLYLKTGKAALEKSNAQGKNGALFGACHERLTIFLCHKLKAVCTALDIPVISSHAFRHSLGTHLLKAGCDMRHIQVILGHEELGTTQQYTHVDKEDLRNSLDQFHPRKWAYGGSHE